MNMLQRIGNRQEKAKKKRERIAEDYWKLSASERLHYDSRRDKIENKYPKGIFYMTQMIIAFFMFTAGIVLIMGYGYDKMDVMIPLIKTSLIPAFFRMLGLFVVIDLLVFILGIFFYSYISDRDLKRLNERFKLC